MGIWANLKPDLQCDFTRFNDFKDFMDSTSKFEELIIEPFEIEYFMGWIVSC